ncbi:hypothetical protein BRADI_1g55415v3 [Brachypodium distachyon]|uniref:Uncharacterized protein n=1 Tax=Brachypodium distachyon TaxID=15368 RepID=A0A2K2DRI8_BRADI|nr:hypothetical protein BRADI_1g55415v3 [Brachypodium distachyon]
MESPRIGPGPRPPPGRRPTGCEFKHARPASPVSYINPRGNGARPPHSVPRRQEHGPQELDGERSCRLLQEKSSSSRKGGAWSLERCEVRYGNRYHHRGGDRVVRGVPRHGHAICWLFRIVEYLVRYHLGHILECDTAVYSSGTCDVHLILDSTRDPIILPPVTPAEHFRVIVHPVSGGQSYEAYLLECREAFHSNRVMGITGVTTDSQPDGIYYCMHIANELKRTDEAKEIVTSGWIYGRGLYAVDMVTVHQDTTITEVLPGTGRMSKWNYWSRCKLKRKPLVLKH